MDKTLISKIDKLKNMQDALKERIQLLEHKEKAKREKFETRKKILIGEYFLTKYKAANELEILNKLMSEYVSKDTDKKLFQNLENN